MLDYTTLLREIKSVMNNKGIVSITEEAGSAKDTEQAMKSLEEMLGSMTIDIKRWGTRHEAKEEEAQERKIIQGYVQAVGGSSPDNILQNLAASFEDLEEGECAPKESGNCNLGKLVSQIQLLNTMSRVLTNFGASEAGFIMEAFLSAMFPGGQMVPVGSGTIADFEIRTGDENVNYSLKTIDEKAAVTGSTTELIGSIRPGAAMIYYIFAKSKSPAKGVTASISVWKFEINYDTIAQVIGVDQALVDQIRKAYSEDPQAVHGMKKKAGKFSISVANYKKEAGGAPVATLVLDPKKLYAKAECELAGVKQQLIEIQKNYKNLVFQMSKYFATMSNTSASKARSASALFSKVVDENVQGDETCGK